jgi:hypothetical protein
MKSKSLYFQALFNFAFYSIIATLLILPERKSLDLSSYLLFFFNFLLVPFLGIYLAQIVKNISSLFNNDQASTVSYLITLAIYNSIISLHFLTYKIMGISLLNPYLLAPLKHGSFQKDIALSSSSMFYCTVIPMLFTLVHFAIEKQTASISSQDTAKTNHLKQTAVIVLLFLGFSLSSDLQSQQANQGKHLGQLLFNPFFFINHKNHFRPFRIKEKKTTIGNIGSSKVNIRIILVDSLRSDFFNNKFFPETYDYIKANDCQSYPHHYSSGHETSYGLYGLLYSKASFYYHQTDNQKLSSLYLESLKANGYQLQAYYSVKLTNLMDGTFILNQFDKSYDFSASSQQDIDTLTVNKYLSDIRNHKSFSLIFLSSPHFPYSYPKGYERLLPVSKPTLSMQHLSHSEKFYKKLRNRYSNSLFYADKEIARVLAHQDANSLKTITVLTSDHGDAFGEDGFIGHLSPHFEDYLIHVPLFICGANKIISSPITSHEEIMPFLFETLGATTNRNSKEYKVVTGVGTPFRNNLMLFVDAKFKYIFRLIDRGEITTQLLEVRTHSDKKVITERHSATFDSYSKDFLNGIRNSVEF